MKSVIVEYASENYAFVLYATRNFISPTIFINKGCDLFATAPALNQWVKAGLVVEFDKSPALLEETLKNAVAEHVDRISKVSEIVARKRVRPVPPRAKASSDDDFDLPPEFELDRDKEPAFFWLFQKANVAVQAMKVIEHLMKKHKIEDDGDGGTNEDQLLRRCIFI